jgi:hypothetical protein
MLTKETFTRNESFQEVLFIHERHKEIDEAHRLTRATTTLDSGRHVWFVNPPMG